MVETTPVVFGGRLLRFEYVRENYRPNKTGTSYFRFVDVESGECTPAFAHSHHFGSAFVNNGTAFVYGVKSGGGPIMRVFWSADLKEWNSKVALDLLGWGMFNSSVCRGKERYVMAIELDKPPQEVGVPFTVRFAESDDLISWRLTPPDCVYSKDRYTACPALRFFGSHYYMIYLEAKPGPPYEPHIVRSRDLVHWQSSPFNPVMQFSDEDKRIASAGLDAGQRERIRRAININNSDLDLCEFRGKTVIYYSWGNQTGTEFLAEAVYDGSLKDLLETFFDTT